MYSKKELQDLYAVCKEAGLYLFVDGARLGYVLGAPDNDMTPADLAANCDVFYIGGTKCGAMFGEAVVLSSKELIPHFFTMIKQHGALLAKGRLLGLQFETLFTDGLYESIGKDAVRYAGMLQQKLLECGYVLPFNTPTNQTFVVLTDEKKSQLDRLVRTCFWEKPDETHTTVRFATRWATTPVMMDQLFSILAGLA